MGPIVGGYHKTASIDTVYSHQNMITSTTEMGTHRCILDGLLIQYSIDT